MAEVPDRLPGEVIFSSYANIIRDRAAMRYADETARDASQPLPAAGDLAYLTANRVFQFYDGNRWVDWVSSYWGGTIRDGQSITFVDAAAALWQYSTVRGSVAMDVPAGEFVLSAYDTAAPADTVELRLDPDGQAIRLEIAGVPVAVWDDTTGQTWETNMTFDGNVNVGVPDTGTAYRRIDFQRAGLTGRIETQGTAFDNLNFVTLTDATAIQLRPGSTTILRAAPEGLDAQGGTEYAVQDGTIPLVRNIIVGTGNPADTTGKDGDVYIRVQT